MCNFVKIIAALFLLSAQTFAWELPADKATLGKEAIREILNSNAYAETGTFKRDIAFIDFDSHGQKFTQVVVTLTPDKPRLHKGKKLVVVGGEPGSEWAWDFLQTPDGIARVRPENPIDLAAVVAEPKQGRLRGRDVSGIILQRARSLEIIMKPHRVARLQISRKHDWAFVQFPPTVPRCEAIIVNERRR